MCKKIDIQIDRQIENKEYRSEKSQYNFNEKNLTIFYNMYEIYNGLTFEKVYKVDNKHHNGPFGTLVYLITVRVVPDLDSLQERTPFFLSTFNLDDLIDPTVVLMFTYVIINYY